jgi:hypothetical protein
MGYVWEVVGLVNALVTDLSREVVHSNEQSSLKVGLQLQAYVSDQV